MINYDYITKEITEEHNTNWPQMSNHPYKILIISSSGSGKTNALLNLIMQQNDDNYSVIGKIYLYFKDSNEAEISISYLKM